MATASAYEDDYDDPDYARHLEPLARPGGGCCFPGECLVIGEHEANECHTTQMIEEYERELRKE